MEQTQQWYAELIKPAFAPEPWVFGLAWGIIYPLMAIALVWTGYLVYTNKLPKMIFWAWGINLVFNLSFSYVQFTLQNNLLAAIWITVVVGSLVWLMHIAYSRRRYVLVALLVPYLGWGLFATVLQYTITYLN